MVPVGPGGDDGACACIWAPFVRGVSLRALLPASPRGAGGDIRPPSHAPRAKGTAVLASAMGNGTW